MKNQNYKILLHLIISIAVSFVVIYFFVFIGGWKLFESGNPLLYELAAAIVVGFIFCVMYEVNHTYENKIAELEKRISELEANQNK